MPKTLAQFGPALDELPTAQSTTLLESGLTAVQFRQLLATGIISVDPRIVSGAVVFAGTRVPVYNLRDYLTGGDSVEDFLDSFPTVQPDQVENVRAVTQWGRTIVESAAA